MVMAPRNGDESKNLIEGPLDKCKYAGVFNSAGERWQIFEKAATILFKKNTHKSIENKKNQGTNTDKEIGACNN